jgi:arylsulfatase A-like enzyme
MTRPSTALLCAAAALTLTTGGCGAHARPNVLVLVMDTTRADRCSFEGYARPTTPRLEEFAKDAVVYRDAWSPAGWTGPAHASLFTGLRPDHHGFHDGDRNYLAPHVPTLAEALQALGYATGCFTNNDFVAPEFGLTRGFEEVVPMYARPNRPYPWAGETHALAAEWAEMQSRAKRPFFLFINDMEPHIPYTPPEDDAKRFLRGDPTPEEVAAGRAFDLPQSLAYTLHAKEMTPRQLGVISDLYDAEIASLDRDIGTLLDRLNTDGLLDSTIVVIVGDHGELFGEHHIAQHGHSLHRPARHVPLLVRYPKTFDGGRVVTSLVRLEDVPATILELCGAKTPKRFDGVSLADDAARPPSIAVQGRDPSKTARFQSMLAGVDITPLTVGMAAVYDGRFHFLAYTDGRRELYDLSRDPAETEDLAAREPTEAARLEALLPEKW